MARYNPVNISGYHISEAGGNALQEIAFTMAITKAYVTDVVAAGVDVDQFASRLSVRYFWGDAPRSLPAPSFLAGSLALFGYQFPLYRLFVVAVTAAAVGAVWFLINRTNMGLVIRAGITDSEMVGAVGINLPLAFTLTFGLGSLLAGLGGALVGPVTGLNTEMGNSFIILAFVVVVIGGLGNFWGSIIGGVLVGVVQSVMVYFWGPASEIVPFVLMIVVLLVRPRGLLGVEGVFD